MYTIMLFLFLFCPDLAINCICNCGLSGACGRILCKMCMTSKAFASLSLFATAVLVVAQAVAYRIWCCGPAVLHTTSNAGKLLSYYCSNANYDKKLLPFYFFIFFVRP